MLGVVIFNITAVTTLQIAKNNEDKTENSNFLFGGFNNE